MKILYNVTIKIDTAIKDAWLEWMINIHIPEVMATQCFDSYKLTKIFGDDDEHGTGFAIQYVSNNMASFEKYQTSHAKRLQKEHSDRFEGKYAAFRTLMEVYAEG